MAIPTNAIQAYETIALSKPNLHEDFIIVSVEHTFFILSIKKVCYNVKISGNTPIKNNGKIFKDKEKRHMKKVLSISLALMMIVLLLPACTPKGQEIRLGTTHFSLKVQKVFQKGEITKEDTEISQVAYYYSDETLVDFDVYQWAKASGETLMDAIEEEVVEFDNADIHEKQVNGIDLVYYYANEEYQGTNYDTVTYIAEDGDYFIEIVFWLDGEDAEIEADEILNSLHKLKNYARG